MMMAGWGTLLFAEALRRAEMRRGPFVGIRQPMSVTPHAVVFAFPIGLRNCDLAERSSQVIARPRLKRTTPICGGTPMVPCRTFFDSSLFLGRVAAEDLLNNFVDLLVVFFRAGVRVDVSARHAAPHHRTGTRAHEINHKHAHKNIFGTAPPTQVPQTVPETHAANVAVEDNAVGDQYIWILFGADLRQSFGRQLPIDGADDALVQGFVRHTMAARPGICFEVREVCLAVITADFLRRGTRAQQDESCYCDECDSHCGSTLLCADKRSSPTSSRHFTFQTDSLLLRSPDG